MTLRGTLLIILGVAGLLWGGLRGAQAQDRGAPRFGPATPGDTTDVEASNAGRIWSLASPPFERFSERYGMGADSAWAAHLRRSMLRLPGCAGTLVSANGLALTSARCVRRHLGENGDGAIVAAEAADEPSSPGLYADRLVRTRDATAEVRAAREDTTAAADVQAVERRRQSAAGDDRHVEVAADGDGTYAAYTYRRHDDVRVAFLPEREVSAFGGLDAAMTYPRAVFDGALLRVYTSRGEPLAPDHFIEPSRQGAHPGDAVFAAGPSRATRRAESAAQLATRRDLVLPERRDRLETWTRALRAHLDTAEGTPSQRASLRDADRRLKRTRARLEALQNGYVQTRLEQRDAQLRRALDQDPALRRRFGGLLDSLAAIQEDKRALGAAYRAFGGDEPDAYESSIYRRMRRAGGRASPNEAPRSASPRPADSLQEEPPPPVETALLAARLSALERHLSPDTTAVRQLLGGQTPSERAADLVSQSAGASMGAGDGEATLDEAPVADVAAVVGPRARSFHDEWRRLTRAERRLTDRLAEARTAVRTAPVVPGGNAPRLTDGRVLGYPYNGTTAPPFTTMFGLYEQHQAFGEAAPWVLPERWRSPSGTMDRSVPLNVVASVDGAVGNSGAPLLTKSLTLAGVAVGPNIQAVADTYLFLPRRMRTVALDVRGLREALTAVYGADGLVDELFGDPSATDRRP